MMAMMTVTLELALAVILVARWHSWPHRLALIVWVLTDIAITGGELGSRTSLIRLLVVIVLAFQRGILGVLGTRGRD